LQKTDRDDEELFLHLAQEEEAAAVEPPLDMGAEDWLTLLLFWGLAALVFAQFFSRYVLNNSISWTEEVAGYSLMALTFLGSSMAARRGTHITVEFLPNIVPQGARRWMHLATGLLSAGFFAVSAFLCWQVAQAMQYQPMIAIDQPLSLVYYGILFGLVLTTLRAVTHAVQRFRAGEPDQPTDPSFGVHV